MKTRRQLEEDLAHKKELWQEEMSQNRQLRRELEYAVERASLAETSGQQIAEQLRQLTESKSLEIRTEALRQAQSLGAPIEQRMRYAYLYEQYLAKGVTLPTETPNLTTTVHNANQAIAGLCEALDDTHAGRLNTIIEALQWAERVSQENIELAAGKPKLLEINSEIGHNLQSKIKENAALKREVYDQANEIEEKTARLKSYESMNRTIGVNRREDQQALSRAKARIEQLSDHLGIPYIYESGLDTVPDAVKIPDLEGFQTSDEAKAFNEVYQPTRQEGLSIYDTAHLAWQAARDYFGGNKPTSGEKGTTGADFTD